MAGSYNHIVLVGRLTRDPEIRYVQSGNAVTSFSLAVNRRTKQGEEAMFVDIVAWDSPGRKLAEICNTYLKKGMTVLVDGRLSIRSYETKEGEKRKVTEVVCNDMQMLDSRGGRPLNGEDRFAERGGAPAFAAAGARPAQSDEFDSESDTDEVPF
ncbi:MAG: single-stranded DNA-binding protein [Candidatus Eremiobacteraeota bacterium]|nr:single-stranded DNA-binding protein [Candidatus Eremiobacteraeota bacterium]MBV9646322.1 single-stranded DNA-binding protein [Candidatus Eremiobacteraeota bacterium]